MFSPQKCWEDSQLSPTTSRLCRDFHRGISAISPKCQGGGGGGGYTVGLAYCEWRHILLAAFYFCQSGVLPGKRLHVCRFYCLPLQWNIVQAASHSRGLFWILSVYVCVCVPSYVPNIFIEIFGCCRHLGPPWVNINLHRQPRPHILTFLWPFSVPISLSPHPTPTMLFGMSNTSSCVLCDNKQIISGWPFRSVSLVMVHRKHPQTAPIQLLVVSTPLLPCWKG